MKKKKKKDRETIAKINKTKSWFFERINKITNHQPDSSRNKGRRIKSTKLEMKMEKSRQTTQKCKGSYSEAEAVQDRQNGTSAQAVRLTHEVGQQANQQYVPSHPVLP